MWVSGDCRSGGGFLHCRSQRELEVSRQAARDQPKDCRQMEETRVGLGLNAGVMELAVEVIGSHYLMGQVVATALVLIWNFIVNKMWSF